MRAQVYCVDCGNDIARRYGRLIVLAKQITNPAKRIAADWHSKRIEKHNILFLVSKRTEWNHHFTRPSLFETKPAQRSRTAREESLTNRQCEIDLINRSILVTIARIKQVRKTKRHVAGQYRVSQRRYLVVMPVGRLKAIERDISAE